MSRNAMGNETLGTGTGLSGVGRHTIAPRRVPADWWRRARACWHRVLRLRGGAPRRLRLCESLPLGERRFVAVVEFEQSRFLLGGTSASLVLLARLENARDGIMAVGEPSDLRGGGQ